MKPHTFHIPVMGTGFTIDTPLKVARFGIDSMVSLGDDRLIERMRRFHAMSLGEDYEPIPVDAPDARARRITAYLDLLDRGVRAQFEALRGSPFIEGSPITRYFELLDEETPLKRLYRRMQVEPDAEDRLRMRRLLAEAIRPGSIDVNIMTKADGPIAADSQELPRERTDAMSALRGFALSALDAAVEFSAGLNLHLFSYVAQFPDFFLDAGGRAKKRIILKVSDFRSALTQGRIFAKKGLWVSEFRIESGLNCGGHAFATDGHLLAPVLDEFKQRREELTQTLWESCSKAMTASGRALPQERPRLKLSAQGGVGTAQEHRWLLEHYDLDSVGWGTPFLLVPEATGVDARTLELLAQAGEADVVLSPISPLGVPFYTLKDSTSEEIKRRRIVEGRPGSPCTYRYLAFDTEFGQPLCTASRAYQVQKLEQIERSTAEPAELEKKIAEVTAKACICHDLGEGVLMKYGIAGSHPSPAICPGPNIAYFDRVYSLAEMIGHIYGRRCLLREPHRRPHCFIKELGLYVRYLRERCQEAAGRDAEHWASFRRNLLTGIEYYRRQAEKIFEGSRPARERFLSQLDRYQAELA